MDSASVHWVRKRRVGEDELVGVEPPLCVRPCTWQSHLDYDLVSQNRRDIDLIISTLQPRKQTQRPSIIF
jgi:hypothetical protein